tara:strand:+ start:172 stop:351 length:180 start_codon:yes stop_codon:yes gene_type:complete
MLFGKKCTVSKHLCTDMEQPADGTSENINEQLMGQAAKGKCWQECFFDDSKSAVFELFS